jgi:serine protease Do
MAGDEGTAGAVRTVATGSAAGVVRIGRGWGRGAGFVIGPGRVATNAHNIRGVDVTVSFADGRTATGRLLGIDAEGDLAVIDVDTGDHPALPWAGNGDAPGLRLADRVVAVTHDVVAGTRVTTGRVSALGAAFRSPQGRLVRDAVEHTAPLARGSSGGPLLDLDGRVVGVNTHRRGDGFYLAIPTDGALRRRLDALAAGAATERPRLGIAVAPPHVANHLRDAVGLPPVEGLLVRGVEDDSPAARAGLRRGDLLTAADGRPLRTSDELFEVLDDLAPGATLTLTVVRAADELTVTVSFGP